MGTLCSIEAEGPDRAAAGRAIERAFNRIKEIERHMSRFRPESEVSRINRSAGRAPEAVSDDAFCVIEAALSVSRLSGGAFDITAGSSGAKPDGGAGAYLDRARKTVFLEEGLHLDLGGIGKGYAVDEAVSLLKEEGVQVAVVDAGGNMYGLDAEARGWWRVGIEPCGGHLKPVGSFPLMNRAVSTSSNSERPGHLLDPRSGTPCDWGGSVTVFAESALWADACSTAAYVLGPGAGAEFLQRAGASDFVFLHPGGALHG